MYVYKSDRTCNYGSKNINNCINSYYNLNYEKLIIIRSPIVLLKFIDERRTYIIS